MAVPYSSLLVFPAAFILWVAYSGYCLLLNYLKARKLGIPIKVIPISHENPLWMLVDKKVFIPIFERIPFGWGNFTRYNWRGWEVQDKNSSHLELGDIFMLVTPGRNWLYLCNAEALLDVFHRNSDFPRPLELWEMVTIFGPNLATTGGSQWQRHRKVTASCFNEQNNALVWNESVRQARGMLEYWTSKDTNRSTADDTRTLSLHVLSCAGFGKSYPFQGHHDALPGKTATTYKESLQTILDNAILLMVLGQKFVSKTWLPEKCNRLHQAVITFKQYMTEVYEQEKQSIANGEPGGGNLMTSLVRASAAMADGLESTAAQSRTQNGLTESEIYGNVFVFNFAGHDTISNTLHFAMVLLAGSPDVQAWLAEEVRYVTGATKPGEWDYDTTFPRLKRCLAVMYETLRLYTPSPIAKSTGQQPCTLTIGGKTITLPENTLLIPNHVAIHTHPRYWGSDWAEWRPSRWIRSTPKGQPYDNAMDNECLVNHKGSFIAWSEGPRICPGKKFSQVEFVATIASLFYDSTVKPQVEDGENLNQARKRVTRTLENDIGQVLLLQMLHPERVALSWERA